MGGHNVIVVDFNNLFIGRKNFVKKKFFVEKLDTKLEYAFGCLAKLKEESPGLTVIPIADPMGKEAGSRFRHLCNLDIDDERKLYMAPGPIGGRGVGDHFVLALANELDAYILSRDRYRSERDKGVLVNSEKIVVPLFLERQNRWIFAMNQDYRDLLRSPDYHELIRFAGIQIDHDESIGYESVLVKALRSKDAEQFVDMLDGLESFSDVTGLTKFDEMFNEEIRDCAFNIYLPRIESEFLGQQSFGKIASDKQIKSPSIKELPFRGLAGAIRLQRKANKVTSLRTHQSDPLPVVAIEPASIRKRAEAHYKFFGDEMGELRRRLGRRVIVTGLMRRDGQKFFVGWLNPAVKVEIIKVSSIPKFPSPALVELRGRVCELDGVVAIEVADPPEIRFVGLEEVISFGQPRREQRVARVSWVLPRFPWSGRFGVVPSPPVVLEPSIKLDPTVEEGIAAEDEVGIEQIGPSKSSQHVLISETNEQLHVKSSEDVGLSEILPIKENNAAMNLDAAKKDPSIEIQLRRGKIPGAIYRYLPIVFGISLGIVLLVAFLL